jgi:lysyl-tRNA synthetase, class II
VAGRIVSWRSHGKSAFAHLEDGGADPALLPAEHAGRGRLPDLDLLDLGDWIGVQGPLFRTRTGEATVQVEGGRSSPSRFGPSPSARRRWIAETGERVVHSGFQDQQTRYRQRYADLAVNPDVREVFVKRTR